MTLSLSIIGILLIYFGGLCQGFAIKDLGPRNWVVFPTVPEDGLKTTGMYTVIRHPIYTFHLMSTLGACLVFQSRFVVMLFFVELWVQIYRSYKEEQILITRYGDHYRRYRRRTLW